VRESSSVSQAGLCKVPASPIIIGLEEMQVWDRADSAQFPSGTFRLNVNTQGHYIKPNLKKYFKLL